MDIKLFNTLGREKQIFKPIVPGKAGMYCCGLTVYNYAHIGNLRAYIFEDILKRTLLYNGYDVKHVMNITDVGHLQSDADEGEDKMELGSSREGKTAWELAEYYTKVFQQDMEALNILPPSIWCKATDHIKEQIELVKCLEEKGYTYKTSDGIYFDSSKYHDYGKLALLDISGLEEGKRIAFSEEKKNKIDFALWKFTPAGKVRQMQWDSPWGVGFPGWHIECSAMSMKYLGKTFDIHCGGVDHIPVHHTNEIAQSEACTGQKFVNYWLHNEFLIIESEKMSKSSGEFLRLQTLIDKGYDPLDYRYFCLGTHYRKHLQFTWENLDAAKNAFTRLKNRVIEFKGGTSTTDSNDLNDYTESIEGYKHRFLEAVNDDLGAPEGLAVMWEVVRNDLLSPKARLELVYDFDRVLGLRLKEAEKAGRLPDIIVDTALGKFIVEVKATEEKKQSFEKEILPKIIERLDAKALKDFVRADYVRNLTAAEGWRTVDKKEKIVVTFDSNLYFEGLVKKQLEQSGYQILIQEYKIGKSRIDIIFYDKSQKEVVFMEINQFKHESDVGVPDTQRQIFKEMIRKEWTDFRLKDVLDKQFPNLAKDKISIQYANFLNFEDDKLIFSERENVK